MRNAILVIALCALAGAQPSLSAQEQRPPAVATPTDVKPGSITCEDVPYPYPVSYLTFTLYAQEMRMAYMDVAPLGTPNGHTVVLFHGNNFAGFYFGGPIEALRREGFRVIVPDQIGYGRSSKPIIPYNFHDWARNTKLLLESLKIDKAMIVGHSMGGMLAARFATQYPAMTSARSRPPTRRFARASCATSRTTPTRGRRSSKTTPASAIRGRSAPTGLGVRRYFS